MNSPHFLLVAALFCALSPRSAASGAPAIEEVELRSRIFGNTRTLRVLLPRSYGETDHATTRYPVCYFTDGRAAFDPQGWNVPGVAAQLWAEHAIPEVIFVGIDNGGSTRESKHPIVDRASEFLPYADPSWTEPPTPRLRGKEQPAFLFTEVMPLINQRYRTRGPAACLAGASYGAIAALYVGLHFPDSIGALLLESPSLHVGRGQLLRESQTTSHWPGCTYVGVGTAEGETPGEQQEMVTNATALSHAMPTATTQLVVTPKAPHSFSAWGKRLPGALRFLLGPHCLQS